MTDEDVGDAGFIVDSAGPGTLFGVLEDSGETGDLYVYDRAAGKVLAWVQVYVHGRRPAVSVEDVEVAWSIRQDKVAARLFGTIHAIIRLEDGASVSTGLREQGLGIQDLHWLDGFGLS